MKKRLTIALSRRQYDVLLKLLTDLPPRDLTGNYSELYAFEVNGSGELETNDENYERSTEGKPWRRFEYKYTGRGEVRGKADTIEGMLP